MIKKALFIYLFLFMIPIISILTFLNPSELGLIPPHSNDIIVGIISGIGGIFITYLPFNLTIKTKKIHFPSFERNIFYFAPFLLIFAFIEELFFRGFIIAIFYGYSLTLGIIVSGSTHAFTHFLNPNFKIFENTVEKIFAAMGWIFYGFLLAILFVIYLSISVVSLAHFIAGLGFLYLFSRAT